MAKVVAPKGLTPLFTVQRPGKPSVAHTPALLGPFSAADHGGNIGLCKLAEADEWQRAVDVVNRQMSAVGGKLVIRSTRACGSPGDGSNSPLYISILYECLRGRAGREEKCRDHRSRSGSKTCTTQVSGSVKVRQSNARSDADSLPYLLGTPVSRVLV
jgi:hypothetical protein